MKFFRTLSITIGLLLVAYLIRQVGLQEVRHSLGLLGWGYGVVLVYPLSWMLLNTWGWQSAMSRSVPLTHLAQIRIAGETFNSLLPSGYIGGEPLKATLLSRTVPMPEAASSVLIAKAGQSVALVLYVILGLTIGGSGRPTVFKDPKTVGALIALSTGIGIFAWLLAHRAFSRAGQWLHRLTGHPWIQGQNAKLIALDDSLGDFYRRGRSRFFVCVFWHFAGWLAGALEVALIFYLMGKMISWRQAWFIGAMAQMAAVIGLFIPAGIGLYEGGHYMAASILGIDPMLGLSVSLIRRVREIFWDSIGVILFLKLFKNKSA